jgi:transcriptional regulator with XRE-family HTH domain
MENSNILDKLNEFVSPDTSKWHEKALFREANRDWMNKSAKIAIRILREIRVQKEKNNMSQKVLAEMLDVSPQYINKVIKGQENLSLDTICKIEKVLGIVLVEVPSFEVTQSVPVNIHEFLGLSKKLAKQKFAATSNYNVQYNYYHSELEYEAA